MRHDIADVVFGNAHSHPRHRRCGSGGGRLKDRTSRQIREAVLFRDDAPSVPAQKVGMHVENGYYGKDTSVARIVLQNFLDSRVGYPWDAVYSEFRQRLDPRLYTHFQCIQDFKQMVVQSAVVEDGIVGYYPTYRYWWMAGSVRGFIPLQEVPTDPELQKRFLHNRHTFFIHPVTKLLCTAKKKKSRWDRKPIHRWIRIDDTHQYRLINENWYVVTLEDMRDSFWKSHSSADLCFRALVDEEDLPDWIDVDQEKDLPPEAVDFGADYIGSFNHNRLKHSAREREFGSRFLFSVHKRLCTPEELKMLEKNNYRTQD